jgi:hypothetical protein
VKNEKVLQSVTEERDVLYTIKRSKANWIGHILHRHCHLKHDIGGKIEGKGRRQKQLLNDIKKTRKYRKLKEEALDCTLWITSFQRVYELVVKTDYMILTHCPEVVTQFFSVPLFTRYIPLLSNPFLFFDSPAYN